MSECNAAFQITHGGGTVRSVIHGPDVVLFTLEDFNAVYQSASSQHKSTIPPSPSGFEDHIKQNMDNPLKVYLCASTVIQITLTYKVPRTFTEVKSTIFWDIAPCTPLKVNRCFGVTYRIHLQGRRISGARNQRESITTAVSAVRTARTSNLTEFMTLLLQIAPRSHLLCKRGYKYNITENIYSSQLPL
jgi:hypothetical protein